MFLALLFDKSVNVQYMHLKVNSMAQKIEKKLLIFCLLELNILQ